MLRSNLCDYSDACIVVKGRITVEGDNDDKTRNKKMIFKTNAPFVSRWEKMFLREKRVLQREKNFSMGENFLIGQESFSLRENFLIGKKCFSVRKKVLQKFTKKIK